MLPGLDVPPVPVTPPSPLEAVSPAPWKSTPPSSVPPGASEVTVIVTVAGALV